jgi:hypothetical protein
LLRAKKFVAQSRAAAVAVLATEAQFHAAYPRAWEFFRLRGRIDPDNKFRNRLWDPYYEPDAPSRAASAH